MFLSAGRRVSLYYRVLFANAAVVVLGARPVSVEDEDDRERERRRALRRDDAGVTSAE